MSGITIFRLAGAKIVEFWMQADNLSMMQQLGVVPSPGG
jgi:predicted ester cyclase